MSHLWLPLVTFLGGALVGALVGDVLRRRTGRADTALTTLLGVAILLAVGYTAVATYSATAELARVTDCQTGRNIVFAQALAARSEATRRSNDATAALTRAQRLFLMGVTDPGGPPEQQAAAYREYYRALDAHEAALTAADQVRADNPLGAAGGCR